MLEPGTRERSSSAANRITGVTLAVLLAGLQPADAATTLSGGEADVIHFAFATQLGSGIYSIAGRTLQVYRIPLAWTLAEPEDGRPGVRLRLPVSVGLYDFAPRDVIDSGLPDHLDTFTAAGGIELDFPLGDGWHVLSYAEAGRAWDRGSDADATLYSASLYTLREWPAGERLRRFQAGIVYAGVDLASGAGTSDMVKVEAGFETRQPLGFRYGGAGADGGLYLLAEWYADRPGDPVVRSASDTRLPVQFEIGLTLGGRTPARIWKLPLPRLGLGYRFGDGVSVYRLVFGAPF
jgi:hypothetical protein